MTEEFQETRLKYMKEEHDLKMKILQKEFEIKEYELEMKKNEFESVLKNLDLLRERYNVE